MKRSLLLTLLSVPLLVSLVVGGCADPLDVEVLSTPPSLAGLPRVPIGSNQYPHFTRGADGADWAVLSDSPLGINGTKGMRVSVRAVRLEAPVREEMLSGAEVMVGPGAIYLLEYDAAPTVRITAHRAGDSKVGLQLSRSLPKPRVISGPLDASFVVYGADSNHFEIVRRDGTFSRTVYLPGQFDGMGRLFYNLGSAYFFDDSGQWFVTQHPCRDNAPVDDPCMGVVAHSTTDGRDLRLGHFNGLMMFDPKTHAAITCGADGLWRIPVNGTTPAERLDGERCLPMTVRYADLFGEITARLVGDDIYYRSGPVDEKNAPLPGSSLRAVPRGGRGLPRLMFRFDGDRFFLAVAAPGVASSKVTAKQPEAASDVWIDDFRFTVFGRDVTFASDGQRLRWLDRVPPGEGGPGELVSSTLDADHHVFHLARFVRAYQELPDGRLLTLGTTTGLQLIDERHLLATSLADEAQTFWLLPSNAVVARLPGPLLLRIPLK